MLHLAAGLLVSCPLRMFSTQGGRCESLVVLAVNPKKSRLLRGTGSPAHQGGRVSAARWRLGSLNESFCRRKVVASRTRKQEEIKQIRFPNGVNEGLNVRDVLMVWYLQGERGADWRWAGRDAVCCFINNTPATYQPVPASEASASGTWRRGGRVHDPLETGD
ncbi:hypothetical protein IWX90DRAFT_414796 [Phyllosticta citrichinensis]|uniref:Uncharacterized protein n=1 Tax=Phyllosticta citrichinensis TaxID=1130410 RepID=A0ABR1XT50_9PEZI